MRDQVSRQVQTDMRKNSSKKKLPVSHVLKRCQRQQAQEEQEDTRRGRRTEPARLYPQRAPDSRKLTQIKHEGNQAELPMRLGVDQGELAVSDKDTGKTQGQACENPRRDARQQ